MLTQHRLTALAATLTLTSIVNAIPTAAPQTPPTSPPVLYNWSTDPVCASTATKTDCSAAVAAICTGGKLNENQRQSVAECTAWYFIDPDNPVPTQEQCQTTFAKILASNNGFGLLGYNAAETRTEDPLYAVYPAKGNGNCFKASGDTSPVLAMDVLPKSNLTMSMTQCGKRNKRAPLEERGVATCVFENLGWQTFCNAACISTVVASSWITGPFAIAGYVSCLGLCDYSGLKVGNKCIDALDAGQTPPGEKLKRAMPMTSPLKCIGLEKARFECPAWEAALRSEYGCEGIAAKGRKGTSMRVN